MALRFTRTIAAGGAAAVLAMGGLAFAAHQPVATAAYAQAAATTTATTGAATARAPGGALQSVLDQLVSQGKLSSTQESEVLTAWQQYLQQHPRPGHGFFGADSQAVASALKLTPQQLQQQIQSGKSIAQIAQAQNVPLQSVQDAIVAAAKSRLDQAVSAGRITSAQETTMLNDLKARLPRELQATPGQFHGGRGPHGPRGRTAPSGA